jgi:hypothetical protein
VLTYFTVIGGLTISSVLGVLTYFTVIGGLTISSALGVLTYNVSSRNLLTRIHGITNTTGSTETMKKKYTIKCIVQ